MLMNLLCLLTRAVHVDQITENGFCQPEVVSHQLLTNSMRNYTEERCQAEPTI